MHVLLLVVSLLSLVTLPACWNPFSKNESSSCGCSANPSSCDTPCATDESTAADENDPMLAAAQITQAPTEETVDTIKQ